MYQIGEFSYLAETTIKTIRYYDKIGLLKPKKIDEFTKYRYYDESQIEIIKKIKQYQQAGFSLEEIKKILKEEKIDIISNKIKEIENENSNKLKILNKIMVNMKENVEVINNPLLPTITKYHVIKNRNEINKFANKNNYQIIIFVNNHC